MTDGKQNSRWNDIAISSGSKVKHLVAWLSHLIRVKGQACQKVKGQASRSMSWNAEYTPTHGHRIVMFLDDGIGGCDIYAQAENCSRFTRSALLDFGFLIAEEKCSWLPSRKVTWLGHIFDFDSNRLYIVQERIYRLIDAIELALRTIASDRYSLLSVRTLASVVGQIMSYGIRKQGSVEDKSIVQLHLDKGKLEFSRNRV